MRGAPSQRFGAPISLILALVFPAMIGAALALAYYGFKHAEDVSRPIEQLFRQESQDFADDLAKAVEARIDKEAVSLFETIADIKDDPASVDPCDIDPGPGIESFVILTAAQKVECMWPKPREPAPPAKRKPPAADSSVSRNPWAGKIKNLAWDQIGMGNFAYHHELLEGRGSVLLAYTTRRVDSGPPFYVVASLKLDFMAKHWAEEELARRRKNRRVAIVDENNTLVAGSALGGPEARPGGRFFYEGPFGKALYRWRIQMVPQNLEAFRAQWEQTKGVRRVLILLSTVIIGVGLLIVWLAVVAERRASRLKSDFIANVSHELKTPLSLIRMFGEMVATGRHKDEHTAREYGGIITRESERLSHLIDNVLDFARLERGKANYHFSEGDLAEVVERALHVCRYRLDKEKMKLETGFAPDLPPLRMDENGMTLVTLNLVDNAIKHAADGGRVLVSLRRAPGFVVLGVRDFGPGVSREEQHRIFERFYRSQTTRERNVRGSGIGLALVKYIVEAHGGRVLVTSPVKDSEKPATGTLFEVFLPAPVAADAQQSAPES
jgi:two-component system, OmpR family, phosphate regulon sensor histidine kinase PhoR